MLTTVVGSYPVIKTGPDSIGSKVSNILGLYDEFVNCLEIAVGDQIEAGIDIISDGQVRGDMIEIFARNIPGMVVEDNIPKIIGKIRAADKSVGASDLKLALKTAKKLSNDFQANSKVFIDNQFNESCKGVKGIITGPTTLVLSCRIEGFYNRDKKERIIEDMAHVLKKEAHDLEKAGAAMIQIDEPFLSTGVADISVARKAIKTITKDLEVPVSMHVCGDIGEILNDILNFPVQIIDCEFAGIDSNIESLKNEYSGSKKIGFGCIDTKKHSVDNLDGILNLIKEGIDVVGKENMILDPDCGMRMLSREMALLKLKKMKETLAWL
jgi:5-methyltetrahydropteroyltriglutamate--homocysteine methyltransferase